MADTSEFTGSEIKRRSEESLRAPRALRAHYDRASGRVVVELTNGCTFIFPTELAQGLRGADPDLLAEVEVEPYGLGLHWERLDADLLIAGLLAGKFGTRAWMEELRREGFATEARLSPAGEETERGSRPRSKKTA